MSCSCWAVTASTGLYVAQWCWAAAGCAEQGMPLLVFSGEVPELRILVQSCWSHIPQAEGWTTWYHMRSCFNRELDWLVLPAVSSVPWLGLLHQLLPQSTQNTQSMIIPSDHFSDQLTDHLSVKSWKFGLIKREWVSQFYTCQHNGVYFTWKS